LKLSSKNYNELQTALGDNTSAEFEGDIVVFKTNKGSFLVEREGKAVVGVTPDNEVVVMPQENNKSVLYRVNQFLPEGVKLTSKNSVMMLNGNPLKSFNMVLPTGEVLMED